MAEEAALEDVSVRTAGRMRARTAKARRVVKVEVEESREA